MPIWIMGRDCEDVLKAAIEVGDSAGQIWNLKTKWGQTLEVFLFASKRTDAVGVVHGAMCVIIPLTVPGTQLECGNLPLENAGDLDSEGITTFSPHILSANAFLNIVKYVADCCVHGGIVADQLSTSEDSSGDGIDDQGYEQPPSPYSDIGTDVDDILWGHWSLAAENNSIGWQGRTIVVIYVIMLRHANPRCHHLQLCIKPLTMSPGLENAVVLDFIFLVGFTSPDTEPFFSGVLVDWCTNEQGSDISASAVNGETCNPLSSARVLVVDP